MLSVLCMPCEEAVESEDSFATLSVMPVAKWSVRFALCIDKTLDWRRMRNRKTYYQEQNLQQGGQASSLLLV